MTDIVEVIQADREVFKQMRGMFRAIIGREVDSGQYDADWQMQLLARHRLASLPASRDEVIEMCAHVAEHLNGWGSPPAPELAEHIAKVIRSLKSPSSLEGEG